MPKLTDHYMLKRYMENGYISEIASIGSFLSPTSWVVGCLLLVIWITTTIPSKKGMWRNESPFLHIPFYFAFIWFRVQGSRFKVQGSRFKVEVAASPQLYMGRCPIKNHSRPFLWKGQTSEARRGWHPRVWKYRFTQPTSAFLPPSKGRREKSGGRWLVTRVQGSRGGFAAFF